MTKQYAWLEKENGNGWNANEGSLEELMDFLTPLGCPCDEMVTLAQDLKDELMYNVEYDNCLPHISLDTPNGREIMMMVDSVEEFDEIVYELIEIAEDTIDYFWEE